MTESTPDGDADTAGFRLHRDLTIPFDGERIAANRYEPTDAEGPQPAVLIATPYRKDDRITFGSWHPSIESFVDAGYEVVVMDLLGTGASTGVRKPFSRRDGEEVAAVIDWLAERDWTTGKVGTFGLSYGAWTQYTAAAADPDALEAMVPVAVVPSVYESSATGGVFNLLKRAPWTAYMQALRALPPSYRDDDGAWREVWHERLDELRGGEPWLFRFMSHERKDAFWDDREVTPDEIDVPVLAACGYRDVHTGPMVEFVEAIDAPTRLFLGPWRHTMPHRGREVAIDFRRRAVEWFDHHLRGEETAAFDGPRVTYWTEHHGGWEPGGGVWRTADAWPPETGAQSFAVAPDGLVPEAEFEAGGSEPPEGSVELTTAYDHGVGVESLDRIGSVVNEGVPANADDARSIAVETARLGRAVELTGSPTATVRVRTSTPAPVVAARLVDVDPTGVARPISSGYLRASHRNGHRDPEPLTPGEETAIEVPMKPRSHVFEAGHRIRLAVAAGHFPRTLPPLEHGELTLVSTPEAPTSVRLPGTVHDEVNFAETVELPEPDPTVPASSRYTDASESGWTVTRRHGEGTVALETSNSYTADLPHGPQFSWENEVTASVRTDAPGSARLQYDIEVGLEYDNEHVVASTDARVGRETAAIATTVTVDGVRVFDESWSRRR